MPNKLKTMTAGEIRQALFHVPDDAPVGFAYPSGDYWKTVLIGSVTKIEPATIKHSIYHDKKCLVDDKEAETDLLEEIILLS